MTNIVIRRARLSDAEALLAIYNHYVAETHISFDLEPRTLEHRVAWLQTFAETGRNQCFVADRGGAAIGWASSSRFKDRAAYDVSIEASVTVAPEIVVSESVKGSADPAACADAATQTSCGSKSWPAAVGARQPLYSNALDFRCTYT